MNWSDLFLRLRALVVWRRVERELDEELRFHIATETRRNLAAGLSADDAARAARARFGGIDQAKEACRDARRIRWIETLLQDVRYSMRGFRRTPLFALTVVATIALGLGLNTTLFTIFNAYVLRPLAVRDPYSLYRFTWMNRNGENDRFSWHQFQDFQKQNPAFSEVLGFDHLGFARVEGHAMFGELVTGNYFRMLGVNAVVGRTLFPEDVTAPGSAPVVVLSFKAWRAKFASRPDIVGKKVFIHGYPLEVVGVAREGFSGLSQVPMDYWAPVTMAAQLETGAGPSFTPRTPPGQILAVGRLRRGLRLGQAETALTAWAQRWTADRPDPQKATGVALQSEATTIPLDPMVIAAFSPIIVAFALVLLIACANVANMMLARAMARQREIGIRLAIGAARARLIRQLLTESVLLALPAGVAGFGISYATIVWGVRLMFATLPRGYADFISLLPLYPDTRVFAFMLLAAVVSALLFGLTPAIQATRANVMQAARGEFTTDFRPARLRNALVIGQVSLSVLLLILAAVLLRANNRLQGLDVGLKPRGVIALAVQDGLRAKVIRQLTSEPLIELVAAASKKPFEGVLASMSVVPEGAPEHIRVQYMYVSPEYLSMFRQSIRRGRNFTADEAKAAHPVAVVSQATAARLWPGRDAIGKSLRIEPELRLHHDMTEYGAGRPPYAVVRVIGIARDVVNGYVGYGADETCIYFPHDLQTPGDALFVRVKGDAEAAQRTLDLTLVHTMDEILNAQLYPYRAVYWVASALSGLALLLTLSGIYGVLSYLVTQRTREIGIRVALGAATGRVAGLVLRQSLILAGTGAAVGGVAAAGVSRLLASQLDMPMFDSIDGVAFAMGVVLVIAASACAAYIPSRRAARIDPVTALRYD
jgi:predicted permease